MADARGRMQGHAGGAPGVGAQGTAFAGAQPPDVCDERPKVQPAVDRQHQATLICRSTADIVIGNGTAFAILARGDGIYARTGRVALHDQQAQQKLRRVLLDEYDIDEETGGALLVPRPSGEPPYPMVLRRVANHRTPSDPLWTITIVDPRAAAAAAVRIIAALYGFTPAETRLATGLAAGDELEDIAASLGVKMPTVRSQLASLFAKTGTRRQAQLVRLLTLLQALT